MKSVEGRPEGRGVVWGAGHGVLRVRAHERPTNACWRTDCAPSVRVPERFPARGRLPPSVGASVSRAAFQSVIPQRSIGLSVSGAVAPSAPANSRSPDSSAGVDSTVASVPALPPSCQTERGALWEKSPIKWAGSSSCAASPPVSAVFRGSRRSPRRSSNPYWLPCGGRARSAVPSPRRRAPAAAPP